MEPVKIVADTGPIIALAKVDRLTLLETLFGAIAIPAGVKEELLAKQSPESRRIRQALTAFIKPVPLNEPTPKVRLATQNLDAGEAEAVALAAQHNSPLLIDDTAGRKAALQLGVAVIGTVGILLRAKQTGHVALVLPILSELRKQGYWFSDELLEQASLLANEQV